jgi:hypothetical protein
MRPQRRVFLLWGACFSSLVLGATGSNAEPLQNVLDILLQCQTAYYRLEDYEGTLLHEIEDGGDSARQETLAVTFRKPGFLSMQWQSGLYKGALLSMRPGGSRGSVVIRLGEGFEYITVSVPSTEVGEPFSPGLKDLNEWLSALVSLAQRPITDRSLRLVEVRQGSSPGSEGRLILTVPAFLIPFRDNAVASYEFVIERGTGIPRELALRGVGGEIRQRMVYTRLHVNSGTVARAVPGEDNPSDSLVTGTEANIDLRGFSQSWQRRYGEIVDYSGKWTYETPDGKDEIKRSDILFKFRKPFDLYLRWEVGAQEALYRRGWNDDRVRIRTAWKGIPLIGDVLPDSTLARWGGRPQVTEFGINRLVERLQDQLFRGWLRGDLKVRFLGVQTCDRRPCYGLEFRFPQEHVREYGAARFVTYWDIAERVPVTYEAFTGSDCGDQCLVERHLFSQLQVNTSLRDSDFDPANTTYGFLLFRQAPRLDRFLTGRD